MSRRDEDEYFDHKDFKPRCQFKIIIFGAIECLCVNRVEELCVYDLNTLEVIKTLDMGVGGAIKNISVSACRRILVV
jgi:hypothetical protein